MKATIYFLVSHGTKLFVRATSPETARRTFARSMDAKVSANMVKPYKGSQIGSNEAYDKACARLVTHDDVMAELAKLARQSYNNVANTDQEKSDGLETLNAYFA